MSFLLTLIVWLICVYLLIGFIVATAVTVIGVISDTRDAKLIEGFVPSTPWRRIQIWCTALFGWLPIWIAMR